MTKYLRAWNLREAFRRVLGGLAHRNDEGALTPDARRFLVAMRRFCYADRSCAQFDKAGKYDTHATAIAEGRREVFIEMQRVMKVTDDELFALRDPDEE